MKRVALAALVLAACDTPRPAPRERAVPAILSLRFGMRPGMRPEERPSSQAETVEILATAGARLECGGVSSSTEAGVYRSGCVGTIPIAGCAVRVSAGFMSFSFEDGVAGLNDVRLDAPDLGDCGPLVEPPAPWVRAEPRPPPWTATIVTALDARLGGGVVDGADRTWRTGKIEAVLHDARLEPCPALVRCSSHVWFTPATAAESRAANR